jgi:hypothetical protein
MSCCGTQRPSFQLRGAQVSAENITRRYRPSAYENGGKSKIRKGRAHQGLGSMDRRARQCSPQGMPAANREGLLAGSLSSCVQAECATVDEAPILPRNVPPTDPSPRRCGGNLTSGQRYVQIAPISDIRRVRRRSGKPTFVHVVALRRGARISGGLMQTRRWPCWLTGL